MGESVAIQGRITVENSGEMRTALANALRTKPATVSVDLSGVSYMDTSGLATLVEAARIAREQDDDRRAPALFKRLQQLRRDCNSGLDGGVEERSDVTVFLGDGCGIAQGGGAAESLDQRFLRLIGIQTAGKVGAPRLVPPLRRFQQTARTGSFALGNRLRAGAEGERE